MRIIAGEFRGRGLLAPEGDVTRPITDRVKQSLFDILSPRIENATVFDCFAGTGSMGLECLSRGASFATFFEADRSALQRLAKNIATLKVGDRSKIIKGDLFKWFAVRSLSPRERSDEDELRVAPPADGSHPGLLREEEGTGGRLANIIFLDPPYRFLREQPEPLQILAKNFVSHLAPDGLVIFRHDAADALSLPWLNVVDQRQYGGMTLEFLQPLAEAGGSP